MPLTLAEFTADVFEPYVGQMFVFEGRPARNSEATSVEAAAHLELVQVNRYGCLTEISQEARGRRPFSLLFQFRSGLPLEQGLCRFIHSDLGSAELFLARVSIPGHAESAAMYEAVFN